MDLALELALAGRGCVEPNPMVGAVIVRDGVEVARAWHRRFGGPHAEVEAIAAARAAGADVRGATIYVTLEPCCHQGKTPPCTRALIEAGIGKVVAAMRDVDARVGGQGFEQLRRAGIEVVQGVREAQASRLLAAYIKLRTLNRPWVICKWAQTADGYIGLPADDSRRWISSEASRRRVHQVRAYCDGILAGIGTVLADDPLLTNRSGTSRQPTPVVLDCELRTPPAGRLMRAHAGSPVLIVTSAEALAAHVDRAGALRSAVAELLPLPSREGLADLPALLDELGRRQWTYLLVEGGQSVLRSFLDQALVDELLVFIAPLRLGRPGLPLPVMDFEQLRARLPLADVEESLLAGDRVIHARLFWK